MLYVAPQRIKGNYSPSKSSLTAWPTFATQGAVFLIAPP